ncbi:hypothetical protein H0H93_005276 [Arthromyces matolae]|nr:hypothetical protein H0H93_005276 [Arthromyces matolae]
MGLILFKISRNAEGYFTLVLCAYRFLIDWHYHNLEAHDSWLEPRFPPDYPRHRRIIESFSLFGSKRNPMAIMHVWLILANALIVSGGSSLAGGMEDYTQFLHKLHKSKIMRTIGQSVFLTFNTLLLFLIIYTIRQYRREQQGKPTTTIHPTLLILLITWPFLFVRGLYGILSGIYGPFNYFYLSNYDANGLKDSFVISEYILATTMEWTSCSLLMFSYITSLNDPPIPPLPSWKDQEKELASS